MLEGMMSVVNCKNVNQIPNCSQLKLIAGENGAFRPIRWVHYIEEPSYIRFIKGQELILTTGLLLKSKEQYLNFATDLNARKISGLVINEKPEGGIPYYDDIVELGNRLDLPIFTLPFACRFVDITQSICHEIFSCEEHKHKEQSILEELFYGVTIEPKNIDSKVIDPLLQFGQQYISVVAKLNSTIQFEDQATLERARGLFDYCQSYFHRKILNVHHGNEFSAVIPLRKEEKKNNIKQIITSVKDRLTLVLKSSGVFIGVSDVWTGIENLSNSMTQARRMAALGICTNTSYIDYDECGVFQLLFSLDKKEELEKFYTQTLAPIIVSDQSRRTGYVETLLTYLKNDCSLKKTASDLFIHYNTLRYRLRSIEQLMNRDFNSAQHISELMLILKIHQYLSCMTLV